MKRVLFLLLFLFPVIPGVAGTAVGVVKEVFKPDRFLVARDYVYIGEKHRVTVYAREDLRLLRQFGSAGEGPREFKLGHGVNSLGIDVVENKLVIGSVGKMSLFSLDGDFIKEFKVPAFNRLVPVAGGYMAATSLPMAEGFPVQAVVLLNKNMQRSKVLLKTDNPMGMGARFQVPRPEVKFQVAGRRIYLADDSKTLSIKVFDLAGNPVSDIRHPVDGVAVSREFRRRLQEYYRTDPNWKDYWEYIKQHLTFPDFFPAVRDLFVDKGRIYVQTFVYRDGNAQWLLFGLNGKFKGRAWLPLDNFFSDEATLHGIRDGIYYQLRENPEKEVWEIHGTAIAPARAELQ